MDLKKIANTLMHDISDHSPEILTGLGIGGFFTAIVMAVKVTPKACQMIEEKKLDTEKDKLSTGEVIQATWKYYIPTAITAGCATACVVGATKTGLKRNAALAAALQISQESFDIYKNKVIETLGEKKESEIREKYDEEMVKRYPPRGFEIDPFPPDTICCFERRYFYSNWDKIRGAVMQIGENMINSPFDPSATLNDWFELVGLGLTEEADRVGWDIRINGVPELNTPSCIQFEDGRICYVISFKNPPTDVFDRRRAK